VTQLRGAQVRPVTPATDMLGMSVGQVTGSCTRQFSGLSQTLWANVEITHFFLPFYTFKVIEELLAGIPLYCGFR